MGVDARASSRSGFVPARLHIHKAKTRTEERTHWKPDTYTSSLLTLPLFVLFCAHSFQEAEVLHCRWAMLGVAGIVGTEVSTHKTLHPTPTPLTLTLNSIVLHPNQSTLFQTELSSLNLEP